MAFVRPLALLLMLLAGALPVHRANALGSISPFCCAPVGTIATLQQFFTGTKGDQLWGTLLLSSAGDLYGTDTTGGSYGMVFEMAPPAKGQTHWGVTVLHGFAGGSDGAFPYGGLIADAAGNLYGITLGTGNKGSVYELSPTVVKGTTSWTLTTLYNFTGGADGGARRGDLVRDSTGALYGTTLSGGNSTQAGVVFKLTPPAKGKTGWTETVLYDFCGQANCADGANPVGGLIRASTGVLYGTASLGGSASPSIGGNGGGGPSVYCGTVFSLRPPAKGQTAWTYQVLHRFAGLAPSIPEGCGPAASLTLDKSGALYGTTVFGGGGNAGTAFKLAPPAKGSTAWTETVLYVFGDGFAGSYPHGSLVFNSAGALFGTALAGSGDGRGIVFELVPPGKGLTAWTEQWLWWFLGGPDSDGPNAGLVFDAKQKVLYGTTSGSLYGEGGMVFQVTP